MVTIFRFQGIEELPGGKTKAKCKLCRRQKLLSGMGTSALKSHMKYQKPTQLVTIKKGAFNFFSKASSFRPTYNFIKQ